MRQEMYGMRRANGDWFAMEVGGRSRVLIFRSLEGAWRACAKNPELMLFRPAPLDEHALEEMATLDEGRPVSFWLVDEEDPAADLRRGHPLGYVQIITLEGMQDLPKRPNRAPAHDQGGPGRAAAARV
jgi:hypothetical protein